MSRKALETQLMDAKSHLAEAQRELELSTFLNKGVLQSNSEFKLRVAELEQENAVLRVAESRLARTEDKVELAERRAKTIAEDLRDKEVEWSGRVRAEIEAREALEVEMEIMREEVKGWREVGERVGGLMARSSSRGERGIRKNVNAVAGPSRSARSTPILPPVSKALPKTQPSSTRIPATSPSVLAQTARIQKRRRRIEDSGDESEGKSDRDVSDHHTSSRNLPERTPTRQAKATMPARTNHGTATTGKKREVQPVRRQEMTHFPPRSTPVLATVKVEEDSPGPESVESEGDPLYLNETSPFRR